MRSLCYPDEPVQTVPAVRSRRAGRETITLSRCIGIPATVWPFGRGFRGAHFFLARGAIVALFIWIGGAAALCGQINDAARTGNLAKVKALLKERPALVSSTAFDGWTPLYEAADNGYFGMAKLLVANGADVNGRSKGGRSPLYLATMYDHRDIVKLLLAHGADANVKDDEGITPLHLAAWHGYLDVAKVLLAHRADVNARDGKGETPLDWARERGDQRMEQLLLKASK
ncbi:MAG: ankyrin repeat domain-containing protein [Limisphaerales bacterium]